jgi:hypothetical protein
LAEGVVVCDFWSGGAASNKVPQAIAVRRLAETRRRRRFTDPSRRKQQIVDSSPEYHRLKWARLDPRQGLRRDKRRQR